ncbi:MAG: DNA mismatch repair protein MutL, partial [Chryseobacterium sp.]
KQKNAPVGTNIYIEGGLFQFQDPIQTVEGSNFSVKNLFYNVPARRKFLKNDNVEFRHIIDEFQRVSLAHENIEFEMFHNDEPVFKLRKGGQMQRIVDVFGRKLQPLLIPIKEDLGWVHLHGYVAKPEGAKKTRGEQFFFVNGRFFRSAYLSKAVQEAFEGLLQPGYIPSFFLYLEMDPEKIDVNIHPQKTEVKFEDEALIFALVRSTIKRSLGIYNVAPSLDFERDPKMEAFFAPSKSNYSSPQPSAINVDRDFNPFSVERTTDEERINLAELYQATEAAPSKINLFEDDDLDEDLFRLPNGYWLLNKDGLTYMLDLGRMHRVIMSSHQENLPTKKAGQSLLFSLEYHLNEIEKNKYKSIKKYLPDFGFEMTLAQENVLRIETVPEALKESQVIKFLEKIFEILEYRTEDEFSKYFEYQWIKLKTKSKFDFIYKTEVEQLVKDFID